MILFCELSFQEREYTYALLRTHPEICPVIIFFSGRIPPKVQKEFTILKAPSNYIRITADYDGLINCVGTAIHRFSLF